MLSAQCAADVVRQADDRGGRPKLAHGIRAASAAQASRRAADGSFAAPYARAALRCNSPAYGSAITTTSTLPSDSSICRVSVAKRHKTQLT